MSKLLLGAVIAGWVALNGTGMALLWRYKSAPGAAALAPAGWPSASQIAHATDRPTLVMMAHPRCPCTRASIHELAVLMTELGSKVNAYVLFQKPAGVGEEWDRSDLWRSASAIPGVRVLRDPGGVEAARFGASTSGQVLLYDAGGALRFSGGITAARGHEGDNVGSDRIVSLVTKGMADRMDSPVFGCALRDPQP